MNEQKPRIVFCITCKGRAEHIARTLPKNLIDNQDYENLKFVILDYNSQDHLVPYLVQGHWNDLAKGRIVLYQFPLADTFKMAHAKNMAHRLGILEGADILVNLDADNYTHEGFASYAAEQFKETGIFLASGQVKGLGKKFRGTSGRIVVDKHAFLKSGGYNEKYEIWSPDDRDFSFRLQRLGYKAVEIDKQYLESVVHGDGTRFREYPEAQQNAIDYECEEFERIDNSLETVVNFGQCGVGVVYRNFDSTPIILDKIPTRIFGIGLHKTATNSLHHALKILGFDSTHWESPRRAKQVWINPQLIDQHYAWSDLPIALLYKELDQLYPGSKFILTVRDEDKWLESVKNHWNPEVNKFRDSWDIDCFTNRIHTELYGRKEFDPEVFLARYRKHNKEIKEYFKNRTDLLVMNMDRGAGWPQLCGFLQKSIPSVDYPKKFVTV